MQDTWVDNISSQSTDHNNWSEFVQYSDTSSTDFQNDGIATDNTADDFQNQISTIIVNYADREKDDSDGWCEVEERPSGVTDTLLQEADVTENGDRIISFAPGEENKPLGLFMVRNLNICHSPQYFVANEDQKAYSFFLLYDTVYHTVYSN